MSLSALKKQKWLLTKQPLARNRHQDRKAGGRRFQGATTSLKIHPVRHCAIDQHADAGCIA